MLVPISWLKTYVEIPEDVQTFCDRMIMTGSNIETVKTYGEDIKNVVIGRVLSVKPHEDSDHLSVCMVDVGGADEASEPLQIVCGAPNVREGILVPVALHGSELPGGHKIKRGKLRGVESFGMICSADELGFDDKVSPLMHKDGIWILPEEFEVGADIVAAMGLRETVVDFEITPNRPDCLSLIGIAREAAASFETKLIYPETDLSSISSDSDRVDNHISVSIKKPNLCARYIARMADSVVIKESPWEIQRRLMFAGMRPINNIVDITNYVMLEYGHPIHAFDIRTVAGGSIILDTPAMVTEFTTLDGASRKITEDMLLVNDAEGGIAVAGVMGGRNSEISKDTAAILIEAASFDMDSVRLTSKKLGIRSEASSRYEKGVPPELSEVASKRVMRLIAETGSGRVLAGAADEYPGNYEPKAISVRVSRINSMLGTNLSPEEMETILQNLEMTTTQSEGVIEALPPYVRIDIKEEVDFVEEIGRIYGYDRLGSTLPRGAEASAISKSWRIRALIREVFCGIGLSEIQTYSFVSPKGAYTNREFVKLINPLGEDTSVMRTELLPNLLSVLATNSRKNNEVVSLFEIGNTFVGDSGEKLPKESLSLAIGAYGDEKNFFWLKGVLNLLLRKLGIDGVRFETADDPAIYHPGRCASLVASSKDGDLYIGRMGQLLSGAKAYDLDMPVVAAELNLERLIEMTDLHREYSPLDKYPPVCRDIALTVDEGVAAATLEEIIARSGGKLLESIKLFDIYRGKQLGEGRKSMAFSLVYRASDRTLTDDEVLKVHDKILTALASETGATLRDA